MVIYYVDVENVGNEWMNIIKDETPNDKILYLFTSKYAHLTYSEAAFLHDYMSLGVVYIKEGWSCGGGSNAIDYYLMGTMNNDIITDENAEKNEYIILSDDKGYDAFIRELKEKGINIRRQPKGEKEILEKVIKIIEKSIEIPCTSCGYCMEVCPKNIPIPQLFGLYNNYKINNNFSNMYHNRIIYNRGKSSDCLNCHRCEKNCPQHIAIPDNLKKIAAFEK